MHVRDRSIPFRALSRSCVSVFAVGLVGVAAQTVPAWLLFAFVSLSFAAELGALLRGWPVRAVRCALALAAFAGADLLTAGHAELSSTDPAFGLALLALAELGASFFGSEPQQFFGGPGAPQQRGYAAAQLERAQGVGSESNRIGHDG